MNHSCAPNVKYHTHLALESSDGEGVYVGLREIRPGEQLVFDYLTGGLTLMPTYVRQRWMRMTKVFECRCERCSEWPDACRGMPCPECAAAGAGVARGTDGLLPCDARAATPQPSWLPSPSSAAPPYLYYDPRLAAAPPPGGGATAEARPWVCARCGACKADDEAALMGGAGVKRRAEAAPAVAALMAERLAPGAPGPAATLERLVEEAGRRYDVMLGTPAADVRW